MSERIWPTRIDGGAYPEGHVQGIAVDQKKGFVYYSFTTNLVKTDLLGNVIGIVDGLLGHLGCIDFNPEDGRVYGSLEYKQDSIVQSIYRKKGKGEITHNAFYVAIFDVDKLTRPGMNAERDGIMTAVYLADVVEDFEGVGEGGKPHRYGCSGIDGTAFGPVFGAPATSPRMLMIAYGIYDDTARSDNDHQIILQYDWREFGKYEAPLCQDRPHRRGPRADARYFAFTGNTRWGVQNLCYDAGTRNWMMFVYRGKKPQYPNYALYLINAAKPAVKAPLAGLGGEVGLLLTQADAGILHEASGVRGFEMDFGQFGVHALGERLFYISHRYFLEEPHREGVMLHLTRYTGEGDTGFEEIEA